MRTRISQTALPFCILVVLVVISALASVGYRGGSEWLPVLGGLGNAAFLENLFVSIPLLFLSILAIFSGLYVVLLKTNSIDFSQTSIILLLIMAANPYSLHFNSIYPVMACMIWFQFCFLENQIFASFMLLSLGSLFYAPAIWFILAFTILLTVSGTPDPLRALVKAFGGACLPHLYLLVFRWIIFDDAGVYLYHFMGQILEIGSPFHLIRMPQYFMFLLLLYILVRAISFFYIKSPKGILEYLLKTDLWMMVSAFIIFLFFYSSTSTMLFAIVSLPASIMLSYYFKNCERVSRTNVEFLLLVCGLLICCISYVVN